MKLSSNVVGDSNNENKFPHRLPSANTQVSKLRKAFANDSSANIELSKTYLHKIRQSRGFLCILLEPLLNFRTKTELPLIGNVLQPLAKGVLITFRLRAAASATDAAVPKKMFGSDNMRLITSNEEMNDIMRIIK